MKCQQSLNQEITRHLRKTNVRFVTAFRTATGTYPEPGESASHYLIFSASCYFFCIRSKHYTQNLVLKHPQSVLFYEGNITFLTHKTTGKCIYACIFIFKFWKHELFRCYSLLGYIALMMAAIRTYETLVYFSEDYTALHPSQILCPRKSDPTQTSLTSMTPSHVTNQILENSPELLGYA